MLLKLKSFPGITYGLTNEHLTPSTASDKGHMVQTRKNLQSTRSNWKEIIDARLAVGDINPPHQICTAIDNAMFCFAALADANDNTIYSILAGQFPVQSYGGNQHIFITYIYTINAILMKPMEGMDDGSMIAVFKEIYEELEIRDFKPKLHVLDNQFRNQSNRTSKKRRPKFNSSILITTVLMPPSQQ